MSVRVPAIALVAAFLTAGCSQGQNGVPPAEPATATQISAPRNGSCTQADLTGVWRLQAVTAAEPGVQDFYRQHPVEYLRFTAEGKYDYVAMDKPLADLAAATASLDRADAGDGVTYAARVLGGGKLIIYRDGQPFQGFMCAMEGPVMVWTEMQGYPRVSRRQVRVR
jgi:hypothetical protein